VLVNTTTILLAYLGLRLVEGLPPLLTDILADGLVLRQLLGSVGNLFLEFILQL
jgi:hypothetical protein